MWKNKESFSGANYMKRGVKYLRNAIIVFAITFCFFSFIGGFIVVGFPPVSRIEIIEFYGVDDNNDTAVDTIEITIFNMGDKKEEITNINFSQMEKKWILRNLTFPLKLQPNELPKQLIFVAATNEDQIFADDEIHVTVYLAREGTDPGIVIDNDDLQRENGNWFTTKEDVLLRYSKVYPYEPYQFLFTLSFIASLIFNVALNMIILIYLMIKHVRSTSKQRE